MRARTARTEENETVIFETPRLRLRDHAFEHLGADRVFAQVRDTNPASMNVAIRLGMTVRGRFVKRYRGVEMPHLAFAVYRESAVRESAAPKPS